jgi:hypothetical protein
MKNRLLLSCFFAFSLIGYIRAQDEKFSITLSTDSVGVGETFTVTFEAINLNGSFTPCDFEGFEIVGGPMSSSSFSMINGVTESKMTYTYYLVGQKKGRFELKEAKIKVGDEVVTTAPVKITVLDKTPPGKNEVLRQNRTQFDFMPNAPKPTKKRKVITL